MARPADHDGNGHSDAAPPSIERQLRVQEAAKILGCSTSHVGQLCDRGEIGCHRDGRWVRIGESQLKEYLERTHVALESNGR